MSRERGGTGRVLLVEDEALLADSVADDLQLRGWKVNVASTLDAARHRLAAEPPDIVLLDLHLPDGSGLQLLRGLPEAPTGPSVVVMTADDSADAAISALRLGAYDYLTKPFDMAALRHRVRQAFEHQSSLTERALHDRVRALAQARSVAEPRSPAMRRLYGEIDQLARHDLPVLVLGETGVGKEHVCRLLHERGPRASKPFVAVNCAELERNLLRSELFGHERGAFTGATDRHRGLFELAGGGTLLLDEVAEMPSAVQAAFLRVLETGRFRRVGGDAELEARVRIVAATNKDLRAATDAGAFRLDLYYRLNTAVLWVPPLRERREDIEPLARGFLAGCPVRRAPLELTDGALDALRRYHWPGNVRELRNVIERTAVTCREGRITVDDLCLRPPAAMPAVPPPATAVADGAAGPPVATDRLATLDDVVLGHVRHVLDQVDGNRSEAARVLGIARSTLLRKIAELDQTTDDEP